MRKRKCMKMHYPESICMAEKLVLFQGTRFQVSLIVHEYYCPICKTARDIYFISK